MSSKSTIKNKSKTHKIRKTQIYNSLPSQVKKMVINPLSIDGKKYDLSQLVFRKSDVIGEGTYAKVYKFRYKSKHSTQMDDNYVVKKIKVLFLRKYYGETDVANKILFDTFTEEVNAIIELSSKKISPKVYGIYVDLEHNNLFYVMQRLDYSLGEIMRKNKFNIEHAYMFLTLLDMLLKTKYRHTDLHIDNVLFDEYTNRFYLIDFGKLKILTKKDSEDYYYTQKHSNKDIGFIDFSKPIDRAILGSSNYSAIATIYKMLVKQIDSLTSEEKYIKTDPLYNTRKKKSINIMNETHEVKECLRYFKTYIKKIVPKKKYKNVIETLDKNVYL
tara:strand:+ start:795 stop:1784 length:990 start_codon:yes stop_codon:yes gene_type:complete